MSDQNWRDVDRVFNDALIGEDRVLEAALEAARAGGLPPIQVAANQGRLLQILALTVGARRILEVGTLAGYSAIWLGRALPPGGRLISLEIDPHHAQVARSNLAEAGLADRVEVRLGPALDSLPRIADEGGEAFDLVFIDADKTHNADYFAWALRLTRPGGLIIVDNVARAGAVADAASTDINVLGVRRLLALVGAEPRVVATAVLTVGDKGHDGFLLARVVG